jgi:hypothetical protein
MTKKLVWLPSFGADPNEAGGSSQQPNIWLGEWWLRSKQPLSLSCTKLLFVMVCQFGWALNLQRGHTVVYT